MKYILNLFIICFALHPSSFVFADENGNGQGHLFPSSSYFLLGTPKQENDKFVSYGFPVDPNEYVLGPGDKIGIDVIGKTFQSYELVINPQGGIVFPQIGFISTARQTITSFRDELTTAISSKLKFDSLKVYLLNPKSVRITCIGAVKKPGILTLKPPCQLSDVIEAADPAPWAMRDSIVIRVDENEKSVNFFNFYKTGNETDNPTIPAGATVRIPSCMESGQYVHLKTKALSTILALPHGAVISDLPVLLPKFMENEKEVKIIHSQNGNRNIYDGFLPISLSHGDTIKVTSTSSSIFVTGMVSIPGVYEYSPSLSVLNYISMAGGETKIGNQKKFEIIRKGKRIRMKLNNTLMPGDVIHVPKNKLYYFTTYFGIFGGIASLILAGKAAGLY